MNINKSDKKFQTTLNILRDEIFQLKQDLKENKLFEKALENIKTPIFIINTQHNVVFCNIQLKEILYVRNNIIGKNYTKLINSENNSENPDKLIQEVFQNGMSLKSVHLMYNKIDLNYATAITNLYPIKSNKNDVEFILFEIENNDAAFRHLVENTEDVIMKFDRKFRHLYTNKEIPNSSGADAEKMIGKTHKELGFPDELVELWEEAIEKVFRTGKTNRIEFLLPDNNWIDWLLIPDKNENGDTQFVITSARNISEIKSYQDRISKMNDDLQERIKQATAHLDDQNRVLNNLLTEKNVIQNKLEEREKLYSTLVNSSQDSIILLNKEGVITFCNEAAVKLYDENGDEDELINMNAFDLIYKEDLEGALAEFAALSRNKESTQSEFRLLRKNGEIFHAHLSTSIVLNEEGEIESLIVITRDISDKKRNEEKLKLSEKKYRNLFENSSSGIMIEDLDSIILDVNQKFCDIIGYTKEELIGKNISIIAHPSSETRVRSNISKIREGLVLNHTVKNLTKNNETIFLDLYERLITDVDGRKKIIITINDATERVKKDREIVEREYRYRVLFNHSPNGILLLNADGAILEANDSFSTMLGYSRGELIGKFIGTFQTSADKEKITLNIKRVLNGEQLKHQTEMKKKNGETRIFELDEVRFPLQENEFGIFMIFNDISVRVENLQKLEQAKLLAEKSARLKSDFLAQISHEIRSPLNVILSFVSFLKDEYNLNDPKHQDIFGSISSAGNRITRTIELILNMSELQQGIYEPHFRKLELIGEVIEPIIEEYAYYADYRGLKLELVKETRSATITADQYSLRQVMANLIDNAIKYTKKGGVKVIVSRDGNQVIVSVEDTGIGIKKEFLPDLFDPFSQEETGYKRKYDGAGLGLSLVKNYCDLNKAEITVESKKNRGAKFRIIFKR